MVALGHRAGDSARITGLQTADGVGSGQCGQIRRRCGAVSCRSDHRDLSGQHDEHGGHRADRHAHDAGAAAIGSLVRTSGGHGPAAFSTLAVAVAAGMTDNTVLTMSGPPALTPTVTQLPRR